MKTHATLEDEIFYPAYKEAVRKKEDQKLYFEAAEEHHVADVVMAEFQDQSRFGIVCGKMQGSEGLGRAPYTGGRT